MIRPGCWFRPKRFGYGATPANWKGWLACLVFVILCVGLVRLATPTNLERMALLVPLALAFVWLSKVKTDGDWHWRPRR